LPEGLTFAISGLRAFGKGYEKAPPKVGGVKALRNDGDSRRVEVAWDKSEGARGYVVRFGTDEKNMHHHFTVIGAENVTIRMLNADVGYYFTVEAFNNGGATKGPKAVFAPPTLK
ncbi:MAG: fibronectin type III domain-containing protein, partial [Defluviitaleaceae bacterium]|nr:fibronectin type III domain-containing protein [Defluviitaleaceae bacterium]